MRVQRRILAVLLAVFMVFPMQVFALDEAAASTEPDTEVVELTEQSEEEGDSVSSEQSDSTADDITASETEESSASEETGSADGDTALSDSTEASAEEDSTQTSEESEETATESEQEIDYSTWTTADFTYTEYSQRLYGCDYSRDFTVSGMAIAGFSETGLLKVEKNTDLVLPSTTDTGEDLVGVASGAFNGKGLTSVKFPTGMYVSYDDTLTNLITQRGNFVIAENAFANNELTSLKLPDGVIAVMSNAFYANKLTTVTLPKTIWWIETQSFAKNAITKVNFPQRTWFALEMHGIAFANNQIKYVRLPDTTAVVNKYTFMLNPGMEALPAEAESELAESVYTNSGVVYMYTDNSDLWNLDRIHHIGKTTASTKSWFQKLVINDGTDETQNPDTESWNTSDFTYSGAVVTGLSESGITKRATNKNLVIPDYAADGTLITEIADGPAEAGGLFATSEETFETVTLPSGLKKLGANVFREAGLTEVDLPPELEEIGQAAFMMNSIETVVFPDTVSKIGSGAFATNPTLKKIVLSKNLTEIPTAAFACSDADHWMADLTSVVIPEGVIKIGSRAFAGNNFTKINIPEGVTAIGEYAFSTKNYLMLDDVECELTLPSTLTTIGNRAFRNKLISSVELPESVTALPELTFEKVLSTYGSPDIPGSEPQGMVTQVYVSSQTQYNDKENFPDSEYHKLVLTDSRVWTAEDFTYDSYTVPDQTIFLGNDIDDFLAPTIWVVTGFSDSGKEKFVTNQNLVIPAVDPDGNKVQGVGSSAFRGTALESELGCKVKSVTFPENVKTVNDKTSWNADLEERGDFFICNAAFVRNELTTLELPEGVISVDSSAFAYNELTSVKFPKTMTIIKSQAFANNKISTIDFPETVDFSLNLENMSFAINNVVSVQLPDNTGVVGALKPSTTLSTVFLQNTGVEPVTGGNAATMKGGIVYMYKRTEDNIDLIYNTENNGSYVQKLVIGTIPDEQAPWGMSDFTFDEEGTTVTGLSEAGKKKIMVNSDLVLPDNGPSGNAITAIGAGVMGSQEQEQIGTFGIRVDEVPYVPTTVSFPSGLQTIGDNAFSAYINSSTGETKGITKAEFPGTLTTIGATAFQNAPITSIILPDSVTTLGNGAFTGTIYASEIVLSRSLTSIPSGAFIKTNNAISFDDMAAIESLEIPSGVESIGSAAFRGCKVGELILPDGLKTIDSNAFNNNQIKALYIPGTVTSIGTSAFAVVNETLGNVLATLEFGEGFNGTIANNAFRGHALTSAEIPYEYSFDNINAGAFNDTENKVKLLTSNEAEAARYKGLVNASLYSYEVVYDKLAGTGWKEADFTYSEDGTAITGFSESGAALYDNKKDLILPDYAPDGTLITEIGDEAFAVPEDEADIGKYEANSNGLTSVVLPAGLVRIGVKAFEYNMLTAIDLEGAADLKTIDTSAFHGNHLQSVHIPDTVDTLGGGAFAMNAITDLKLSKNVTVIPSGAFSMNIRMSTLEIPDTVTEIGEMAFAGARLTELEIPKSVTKICRKAFHLHHLETLTVPGNVKEIEESAFEGTYKEQTLLELKLEEGIETIGTRAFKEGLLTTVALPASLKTMGTEPFENNTGTGDGHVVILTSTNPEHLNFNEGAKYHLVIVGENVIALNTTHGSVDPGYLDLADDGTIAADTLPVPTNDDACYEFLGWYTERDGGKEVTTDTKFSSGDVIYAHWKEEHEWGEPVLSTAPTADSDGVITYTCTRNESHTRTEKISYAWEDSDFVFEGGVVKGLTDIGKLRVSFNPDMVIPDKSSDGTVITEIGDGAFRDTAVETVKYPSGLTKIGQIAFHTTKLKEAIIPQTVTSIGEGAYAMNWDLAKISLPDGITAIPAGLFNRQLTKGDNKYDDFPSVGAIEIPDGVTSIGMAAFFGLSAASVSLPDGLTEMGQSAFANNMIAEVTIPGSLKDIPRQAFSRGKAMFNNPVPLSSLTLNEGTETIGTNAFENSALVSVKLPTTMKSIDDTSFRLGVDAVTDEEKILLRGTPEQHFDTTLNTGTGLGHRFAPLITFDPTEGTLENIYAEVNDDYKLDELPVPEINKQLNFEGWYVDEACTEKVTADTTFINDAVVYANWAEWSDEDVEAREEAARALEEKIVDAISTAAAGEYTSESYQALMDAIDSANALCDDPSSTAQELAEAQEAVNKALRSLKPVDKAAQEAERDRSTAFDALARNVIDAKNSVIAAAYKAASYTIFKNAFDNANALIDDNTADAETLRKANSELLVAWKNLEQKSSQKMTVKAATKKLKAKKVKKAKQTVKAITVKNAQGKVTYKKVSGSKKLTVNAKTGKITVKKGTKKGTYKINVKVTAAGNGNYKAASKTVTVKIKVK